MPFDLPPNLNQVAASIIRAVEQAPKNPNSQIERNRKNDVRDATNRKAAEQNRPSEQRPK
ncbi:hypothetical protein [Kocuria sp.]|uniref:hypothetical protein n=1 Tax=Kocuria sp. TaxID=1871328 RepID=UPI0025C0F4A4|nr:hypothetical protein [Kocuria sp.]